MAEVKENTTLELTEKEQTQDRKETPDISAFQKSHDKVQEVQIQEVYEESFDDIWETLSSAIDMGMDNSTEREIFTKYFDTFLNGLESNKSEAVKLYHEIISNKKVQEYISEQKMDLGTYISIMNYLLDEQDYLEGVEGLLSEDFGLLKDSISIYSDSIREEKYWRNDLSLLNLDKQEDIKDKQKEAIKELSNIDEIKKRGLEAVNSIMADFPEKQVELKAKTSQIKDKLNVDESEATILAFQSMMKEDPEFRMVVARDYADKLEDYKKALDFSPHKDLDDLGIAPLVETEATNTLLDSGHTFVEVKTNPKDLGLLVEKVLEIHKDVLMDTITESDYGISYIDFVEYAEIGVPEDKMKEFNRVQEEVLMPLVVNFQEYVGASSNQALVMQARNGMYQYIKNMLMVPTEDGYIGNLISMNLTEESVNGEVGDYSFGNTIKYKGIPLNIGIDGEGNVSLTDYITSEKGGIGIGEDLQVNNLFQGVTINDLLASCPEMDMMKLVENAKSVDDVDSALFDTMGTYVQETLASKIGEMNNAQVEMGWEMEKQVTLNAFLKSYQPPVHEYRFGNDIQITKEKNPNFYKFLKVVDNTAGDSSSMEMKEYQRIISNTAMNDLMFYSGLQDIATMEIMEDLNLLKGSIEKRLDIRKVREFAADLQEGDENKLNLKYSMGDKEFQKENGKIFIKKEEEKTSGLGGIGSRIKKMFG